MTTKTDVVAEVEAIRERLATYMGPNETQHHIRVAISNMARLDSEYLDGDRDYKAIELWARLAADLAGQLRRCTCGHGPEIHWSPDPREDCLAPCRVLGCKCHTFTEIDSFYRQGSKLFEAPMGETQDLKPDTEADCMEGGPHVARPDFGARTNPRKPRLPK